MFNEGTIKAYNENRGFGFIKIEGEEKDLFFHITDFPHKQYPPKIGEKLEFRIVSEAGKIRAENIVRLDLNINNETSIPTSTAKIDAKRNSKKQSQRNSFNFINLLARVCLVVILAIIFIQFVSGTYERESLKRQSAQPFEKVGSIPNDSKNENNIESSLYRCDGRVHCSDMKSYEEAVFFINNCPGTKMDGDGEPCEG